MSLNMNLKAWLWLELGYFKDAGLLVGLLNTRNSKFLIKIVEVSTTDGKKFKASIFNKNCLKYIVIVLQFEKKSYETTTQKM